MIHTPLFFKKYIYHLCLYILFYFFTYQSNKNTEELHDVSVGHRVKSSNQGVKDGNKRRDHHRHLNVDVHDDAKSGSWGC